MPKIDYTGLKFPKEGGLKKSRGVRTAVEKYHYERLKEKGCCICGAPAEVHHSLLFNPRRNDRIYFVCPKHHRNSDDSVHKDGNEVRFFNKHGIDARTYPELQWDITVKKFAADKIYGR